MGSSSQDQDGLAELKAQYQRGGLGDGKIKARLEAILQDLIAPIRERRAKLSEDRGYVLDVISCLLYTSDAADE